MEQRRSFYGGLIPESSQRRGRRLAVLALGLGAAWSVALAAPSPIGDCDLAPGLKDLQGPPSELRAAALSDDTRNGAPPLRDERAPTDRAAPVLYLTPRLAAIVERIFSAVPAERRGATPDEPAPSSNDSSSSKRQSPGRTDVDSEAGNDGTDSSPRYSMYRKDI